MRPTDVLVAAVEVDSLQNGEMDDMLKQPATIDTIDNEYYLCSVLLPPCCAYTWRNVNVKEFCHACLPLRAFETTEIIQNNTPSINYTVSG